MEYPKEPFNFKLFMCNMLSRWYLFVSCTLIGAVLFGGTYYLYKVVYAPAREFQASATYYIEYAKDPVLAEPYSYFNAATLDSWLTTDVFVNQVLAEVTEHWTVEELDAAVELVMPSDVRVVQLQVKTADSENTIELLKAYDKAFMTFAAAQREISEIRVQDMSEEAIQIKADIRTQRAFVLGGVLGLFFGGLVIGMRYLLDDGIYLPETLAKRHGLKVFGTDKSEELAVNLTYAVKDLQRVAVTGIGDTPALPQVYALLQKLAPQKEWVAVPAMVQCPEAAEALRACDGVVLTVMYGADKSGAIDRALSYYAQQDINVLGAILWDVEEGVFRKYLK